MGDAGRSRRDKRGLCSAVDILLFLPIHVIYLFIYYILIYTFVNIYLYNIWNVTLCIKNGINEKHCHVCTLCIGKRLQHSNTHTVYMFECERVRERVWEAEPFICVFVCMCICTSFHIHIHYSYNTVFFSGMKYYSNIFRETMSIFFPQPTKLMRWELTASD